MRSRHPLVKGAAAHGGRRSPDAGAPAGPPASSRAPAPAGSFARMTVADPWRDMRLIDRFRRASTGSGGRVPTLVTEFGGRNRDEPDMIMTQIREMSRLGRWPTSSGLMALLIRGWPIT